MLYHCLSRTKLAKQNEVTEMNKEENIALTSELVSMYNSSDILREKINENEKKADALRAALSEKAGICTYIAPWRNTAIFCSLGAFATGCYIGFRLIGTLLALVVSSIIFGIGLIVSSRKSKIRNAEIEKKKPAIQKELSACEDETRALYIRFSEEQNKTLEHSQMVPDVLQSSNGMAVALQMLNNNTADDYDGVVQTMEEYEKKNESADKLRELISEKEKQLAHLSAPAKAHVSRSKMIMPYTVLAILSGIVMLFVFLYLQINSFFLYSAGLMTGQETAIYGYPCMIMMFGVPGIFLLTGFIATRKIAAKQNLEIDIRNSEVLANKQPELNKLQDEIALLKAELNANLLAMEELEYFAPALRK